MTATYTINSKVIDLD